MKNVFNVDQMKDIAFNACCRNLEFYTLLSTTIDRVEDVIRVAGDELVLNCVKVS